MSLFDTLYNITKEAAATLKKPLVKNKVQRAFDAAVESMESAKIDNDAKLDELRQKVANGEVEKIKELATVAAESVEIESQKMALAAEKAKMFE